ncbi:hypothetical protein [Brevibacterium linens]|uniref:hypothetical protein n=1 Tax=Brevibacterium linens TaxID=1703 RepID=UPI000A6D69EC|nr:hypothetical protein [Brevibacterium linens]
MEPHLTGSNKGTAGTTSHLLRRDPRPLGLAATAVDARLSYRDSRLPEISAS